MRNSCGLEGERKFGIYAASIFFHIHFRSLLSRRGYLSKKYVWKTSYTLRNVCNLFVDRRCKSVWRSRSSTPAPSGSSPGRFIKRRDWNGPLSPRSTWAIECVLSSPSIRLFCIQLLRVKWPLIHTRQNVQEQHPHPRDENPIPRDRSPAKYFHSNMNWIFLP